MTHPQFPQEYSSAKTTLTLHQKHLASIQKKKRRYKWWGMVVHACNPSYSGGGGRRIMHGSKPARAKAGDHI
jgi:hypothetical protein